MVTVFTNEGKREFTVAEAQNFCAETRQSLKAIGSGIITTPDCIADGGEYIAIAKVVSL
jgi:hypothetical protein